MQEAEALRGSRRSGQKYLKEGPMGAEDCGEISVRERSAPTGDIHKGLGTWTVNIVITLQVRQQQTNSFKIVDTFFHLELF